MTQPLKKLNYGKIQAAVWNNEVETKDGRKWIQSNVTIEKRYKGSDGVWKSSSSYDANDLADLIMLAEDARRFLKGKQDLAQE